MSLRNVHVVFVVVSTLLALFCGAEAAARFRDGGSLLMAAAATLAVATAAGLVGYEVAFLRRCREAGIR